MKQKTIKLTPPTNLYSLKIEKALNIEKESNKLEMMWEHYAFFGKLNQSNGTVGEEYVTREAIIRCSLGTNDIKLDLCEDHGVIAANEKPLMTCEDCNIYKNISSFGTCKGMPSNTGNHCIPMLGKKWMQKEENLLVSDGPGEKYVEALRSSAYLTCLRGGLITVKGIPIPKPNNAKFIKDLKDQGFTDGYIRYLVELHDKYPKWKFEAVITDVDYEEFVDFQVSNVEKCARPGEIYATNTKFPEEAGYNIATRDAIIYFSNPYSMLLTANRFYQKRSVDELEFQTDYWRYDNLFQFLKAEQKLDKSFTDSIVEQILCDMKIDQVTLTELIDLVKNSNFSANPIFVAAVIAGENGPYGEIYGKNKVYNIFNIGADNGREDSKKYANDNGWYSLKACWNGSKHAFGKYFGRQQNTLYALDWDYGSYKNSMTQTGVPTVHQFATLVNDAEDKAIMMTVKNQKRVANLEDQEFVFSIPVYTNILTYNNKANTAFPDPNRVADGRANLAQNIF